MENHWTSIGEVLGYWGVKVGRFVFAEWNDYVSIKVNQCHCMAKKTITDHEIEYKDLKPKLERLEVGIVTQLNELLKMNKISLGFPIQSRIKNLDSIKNKIEGNLFDLKRDLTELQDLVGVRIIN